MTATLNPMEIMKTEAKFETAHIGFSTKTTRTTNSLLIEPILMEQANETEK